MGQAKRKQGAWGRKVSQPVVYADAKHYRGIPLELLDESLAETMVTALVGTGATVNATLPSPTFPDRNVHEWSLKIAPDFDEEAALIIDFGDGEGDDDPDSGEYLVLHDETLHPITDAVTTDFRILTGQGFRFAEMGNSRRELAIDVATGLLVDKDGNHPDPTWFEDKVIILPDDSVFSMQGSFAMRVAALVGSTIQAMEADEEPLHFGLIANHLLAHAGSCRSLAARHRPLAADIEAAHQILDDADILVREVVPGGNEMVLFGALHVVRDCLDEMADIYSVRHFCEQTGYSLAGFRQRGQPDDMPVWAHFERAARMIGDQEGESVILHPDNSAWITLSTKVHAAAAMIDTKFRPFIESGRLIGEIVYPADVHRAWRHDGMIIMVREMNDDFLVVLSDEGSVSLN